MNIQLISKTTAVPGIFKDADIEQLMIAKARASSSRKNLLEDHATLLRRCLVEQHWSVFELADLTFRIETSRAIGREILRHRSFVFQELSQRYATVEKYEHPNQRLQALKNRQSSTEPNEAATQAANLVVQHQINEYNYLIGLGMSRETARMVLPEAMQTVMYVKGSVRSWITFLHQRLHETAQLEIRLIANQIAGVLITELPQTCKALNYFKGADKYPILNQLAIMKHKNDLAEIMELWSKT